MLPPISESRLSVRPGRLALDPLAVERAALDHTIRPEETKYVLRYLGTFPLDDRVGGALLDYLESPEAVYDYPMDEIVKWFFDREARPERLLRACRRWAFDKNRPPWLRAYCMAVLGQAADPGDMDMIECQYGNAISDCPIRGREGV